MPPWGSAVTPSRLRKRTTKAGPRTPLAPVCDDYDAAHHPVKA